MLRRPYRADSFYRPIHRVARAVGALDPMLRCAAPVGREYGLKMTDDNRVVQGLWVGGRLSALERLCILSFCAHGHEFHLYHYDELQNVPRIDGLRLINGEKVLPRAAIFHSRLGGLTNFADHFRWELLRQRGGWWVDMDMVCVRPFDFAAPVVFAKSYVAEWIILNGVLKFPPGHALPAALSDAYADIDCFQPWDKWSDKFRKARRRLRFWRDSRLDIKTGDAGGMRGFRHAANYFGVMECAIPNAAVHLPALSHSPGRELVESAGWNFDKVISAPELHCVNMNNAGFEKDGINKDGDYPSDSLYEVLKQRYLSSHR